MPRLQIRLFADRKRRPLYEKDCLRDGNLAVGDGISGPISVPLGRFSVPKGRFSVPRGSFSTQRARFSVPESPFPTCSVAVSCPRGRVRWTKRALDNRRDSAEVRDRLLEIALTDAAAPDAT